MRAYLVTNKTGKKMVYVSPLNHDLGSRIAPDGTAYTLDQVQRVFSDFTVTELPPAISCFTTYLLPE